MRQRRRGNQSEGKPEYARACALHFATYKALTPGADKIQDTHFRKPKIVNIHARKSLLFTPHGMTKMAKFYAIPGGWEFL